jgi:hypothetical protein
MEMLFVEQPIFDQRRLVEKMLQRQIIEQRRWLVKENLHPYVAEQVLHWP